MSPVFTYRMPAGIPGDVSRSSASNREPVKLWPHGTTGEFVAFGLAGVIDATSGEFRVVKSTDASISGFLVRAYPINGYLPVTNQGLGAGSPPDGIGDRLTSGYMTVKLYGATAAKKGGVVYIRLAVPGSGVIGGVEAAADSTNTLALDSKSYFMGPADADGNVEICYNI